MSGALAVWALVQAAIFVMAAPLLLGGVKRAAEG